MALCYIRPAICEEYENYLSASSKLPLTPSDLKKLDISPRFLGPSDSPFRFVAAGKLRILSTPTKVTSPKVPYVTADRSATDWFEKINPIFTHKPAGEGTLKTQALSVHPDYPECYGVPLVYSQDELQIASDNMIHLERFNGHLVPYDIPDTVDLYSPKSSFSKVSTKTQKLGGGELVVSVANKKENEFFIGREALIKFPDTKVAYTPVDSSTLRKLRVILGLSPLPEMGRFMSIVGSVKWTTVSKKETL